MPPPSNPVVPLGRSGLSTARLGYGCMSLSGNLYAEPPNEEEATQLLRTAYNLGVRLFNTSDLYGPYTNEELLGRALPAEQYPDAFIATKWGAMFYPGKGIVMDNSRENCRKFEAGGTALRAVVDGSCEGALKRLQRPAIDLFVYRGPPPADGPSIEETMEECKLLLAEGKIRGVGLSEVSAEQIRAAARVVPIAAVECEWSLFTRDVEEDIVPTCRELGIAFLAYSPLGRGILTGKIRDISSIPEDDFRRKAAPRFDALSSNLPLVDAVAALAERKGCSPGQLALGWLLAQGPDVFPIPGTRKVANLEENMGALGVTLSAEELKELAEAVPPDQVVGTRYAHMAATYHGAKGTAAGH